MTDTPTTREMVTLPSTTDKRPSATDFDSIIYVKVGKGGGEQTFDVYKGVLRFYSGYFRTAIENIESGRFAESQNGVIKLPDHEPGTFNLFRAWLHRRVLPIVGDPSSGDDWARLIKLWCFGGRHNIPLLQNETLSCIAYTMGKTSTIPTDQLRYVWKNTTKGAKLRTYFVKTIWTRFKGAESLIRHPERYSFEIVYDLLLYGLEKRPVHENYLLHPAFHHSHIFPAFFPSHRNLNINHANMTGREAMALPSTPAKKPSITDFDRIIRIKVGQTNPQIFDVHKGVLKFYSGYFRKVIENVENGRFAEAEENMITLPDEETEVFKLFQGWLYTRELPKESQNPLIKLWCFGDRRAVPLLQNEAIDAIREVNYNLKTQPDHMLRFVFDHTTSDAPLRSFLITSIAARCTGSAFVERTENWPVEALHHLIKHFFDERPKRTPRDEFNKRNMCEWHVHEEGVKCD
ncbi:hypothetical protein HII31_09705 [Pseudocercospora fuligena]|uniref:BTB domain-containing protein n=1 Tax=Pseudocercospora fuligena TaxID=685502 RepID=A0A8H6RE28_9PEZI|nr:hypothetical protein HII31_09705 [Pseudocercospora fuligena]